MAVKPLHLTTVTNAKCVTIPPFVPQYTSYTFGVFIALF